MERVHGTLVEVAGVGVLLLGPSGIGKSECAAELVIRGYRFVADDVVLLSQDAEGNLIGEAHELVRHYMEIRGLGIVHIPSLFGAGSVAERARVELVVELEVWGAREVDRVGIDRIVHALDGLDVPAVRVPVAPGRNMATLVQLAARKFLHDREGGLPGAVELDARVLAALRRSEGE
jgi:HPr kinase/phosphorylase